MASLGHLAFLLHSLSITFALSQSIMQLFLSAWSVIADLCSITIDTLLFPGKSPGCDVFNLLVSFLFADICVVTALTRDLVYTVCLFYYLPLCPLDTLVFF